MNVHNWPAHRVEVRKRAELRGYERNSRTHSEEQVAQIAASIREWGWTVPVLVDPLGEVIAGHGRLMAAERLGIDDIPCMVADGWTEAQKRAYVIADNKLAENGGWDESILAGELAWLAEADFGVDLIGFSDEELGGLLNPPVVGKTAEWRGGRKQTTVWFIEHLKNDTGHGTQKPVECMRRPIVNNSSPGQAVYEPFCGSGTTIIAGEMEGRHVYAMELSEVYCDVIVRRWQEFTGREATLEATGQTYAAVAAERLAA